eukprot:TRINITY_DN2704_c0_g1_i5.p2 TRINITY_DN2704_c0_g1~~TRINITY_DN2704_c0_g1_i5.p2  ORF type:complete len:160 (-),score=23.17 TRINITY_DN2704_c0_g1_i5:137-616(-)
MQDYDEPNVYRQNAQQALEKLDTTKLLSFKDAEKIPDQTTFKVLQPIYCLMNNTTMRAKWLGIRRMIAATNFLERFKQFDPHLTESSVIQVVHQCYVDSLNDDVPQRPDAPPLNVSLAAWVIAITKYKLSLDRKKGLEERLEYSHAPKEACCQTKCMIF